VRRHRVFRRLWLARMVSFTGDSLALVALVVHVAHSTGEALAVAALLLAGDLAPSLLSPWTATLADRVDQRRLMLWCEVLQAGVVAALIASVDVLGPLLALVAVRALLAQTFQPASRAAVPRLVDDADLEAANAAIGLATFGLEALGAALAAALIALVGIRGALAVDACTFLVSAALIAGLPRLPPVARPAAASAGGVWRDAVVGVRHVLADPLLRIVVVAFAAFVAWTAVDDVALVLLGRDSLHIPPGLTALLYAGPGVGLLVGFAVAGRLRAAPAVVFVTGLAVAGAGTALTGLAWAAYAAFAFQVLRGAGAGLLDVGSSTLVQRAVPAELHGRVFGNLYGVVGLAAGVSYLAGGGLLTAISPRVVFVLAGCGGLLVAGGAAAALARRARAP